MDALDNEVTELSEVFKNLLIFQYIVESEEEINNISEAVTSVKKEFDNKCRELETAYQAAGEYNERRNAKRLRLKLLRELYEFHKELNESRRALHLEELTNRHPKIMNFLFLLLLRPQVLK